MGKVESVKLTGILSGVEAWFPSNDHVPPHLHVSRPGEWTIKVYLVRTTATELVFEAKSRRRQPNGREQRALAKLIDENKPALLAEFRRKTMARGGDDGAGRCSSSESD